MADQHNANVPAVGNLISNDIPDIKENLEFHKDALERIFETWSDTDNSAAVIDSAVGFYDGTYTYDFPTNGVAGNSIIMLGNSDTIVWMYLNAAPPGWKVLATGADTVLAISGGSEAFNTNGGTAGGSWASLEHTHDYTEVVTHTHTLGVGALDASNNYFAGGDNTEGTNSANSTGDGVTCTTDASTTLAAWRPSASVGKLFQLDTA